MCSLVYISVIVADYPHETNDCYGKPVDWMEQVSDEQYEGNFNNLPGGQHES